MLRPVVLGIEGVGSGRAARTARVAGRMAGDLSARGARSRQWGLESTREPHGESRRNTRYQLMPLHLEIVTPERLAYSDEVDMVLVPGIEGEMGILPAPHAARQPPRGGGAADPQGWRRGELRHRRRVPPGPPGQGRRDGRDRGHGRRTSTSSGPRRPGARRSGRSSRATSRVPTCRPPARSSSPRCCASGSPSVVTGRALARGGRHAWLMPGRSTGSTTRNRRPRRHSGSRVDGRCRAPSTCRAPRTRPSSCSPPPA